MRQGSPIKATTPDSLGALLDAALRASDIAAWQLDVHSRQLTLLPPIADIVPELGPLQNEEQLLALMLPADQYIFRRTFSATRKPGQPVSCEVCLAGLASEPHLRFVGSLQTSEEGIQQFVGVVVDTGHWLANPGPEYEQSILSRLFAESPIASLVTDAKGTLLEYNHALVQLFQLTQHQAARGIGHYQILRDRSLRDYPECLDRVRRVFQQGEIHSFDLDYPLATLHRNLLFKEQRVPIKISFMPLRDRHGKVNRVLVQCQDLSGEHNAHQALQHRDQLLYSVINNSHNLVSVKSTKGQYLLVNHSFADWFGRDEEDICVRGDASLFPSETIERFRQQEQRLLNGKSLPETEELLLGRDGKPHSFLCVGFPIADSDGKITAIGQIFTDITRQKDIEHSLQSQRQELRLLLDSMRSAVWYFDRWGAIKDFNKLAQSMMPVPLEVGKTFLEVARDWDNPAERQREIMQVVRSGEAQLDSIESAQLDRSRSWFSVDKIPTKNSDGSVSGMLMVVNDITARKHYEERLEHQASHDALTHLPNRGKLYEHMEHWLADQQGRQSALLLIDLDRFKEINDTLGHQVGDALLCQVGPRLESELTELGAIIARLGGDEFAIFLPDMRHAQQARVIAHRALDALRDGFDVQGYPTEISASIGIAMAPEQAQDVSTLMRYADVAMYCAKSEMTGVALYNAEKDPHSPKRLAVMNELGRGIREQQLEVYFQPKVELAGKRCCGGEALLRWQHPELGFISPAEFIPIAEATNLIHPLTRWVLEESIRACCRWHQSGWPLSVSVNLSARNLLDESLPKTVETLLEQYQLPHWALELEITESSIMTDPRRAMTTLERLHELGVMLAIDDFGTGYSSLAYLKRLPVQTLKIDYSFVLQMLADEQDEIIVKSTIQLAHNLGLSVVAEGVETLELLERLTQMGCDLAQGYHIGRPMPLADFEQWLASSGWVELARPEL